MKKLLSLLSVLTITGTAVPTTIAASPYQKEETIKNSDINYQQTNNLEKLNRTKRDVFDGILMRVKADSSVVGAPVGPVSGIVATVFFAKENCKISSIAGGATGGAIGGLTAGPVGAVLGAAGGAVGACITDIVEKQL